MERIRARRYDEYLREDGRGNILTYSIPLTRNGARRCAKNCNVIMPSEMRNNLDVECLGFLRNEAPAWTEFVNKKVNTQKGKIKGSSVQF